MGMAALAAPQQVTSPTPKPKPNPNPNPTPSPNPNPEPKPKPDPNQASGAMPVLIVGCGAAARVHVDAMRATGRFECVALADTEPAAAAALSAILVSRGGKPPKVFIVE